MVEKGRKGPNIKIGLPKKTKEAGKKQEKQINRRKRGKATEENDIRDGWRKRKLRAGKRNRRREKQKRRRKEELATENREGKAKKGGAGAAKGLRLKWIKKENNATMTKAGRYGKTKRTLKDRKRERKNGMERKRAGKDLRKTYLSQIWSRASDKSWIMS